MLGLLIFIILTVSTPIVANSFEIDTLRLLLEEEMKRSPIGKEVSVGNIRFIGFVPTDRCQAEKLKIREIRRPNIVEFTFQCGGRLYRAQAEYEALVTVFLTQRMIRRGEEIGNEDIVEIKRPIGKVPAGAVFDRNQVIGRVMKRTVAQGVIIKDEHLYRGTPVKRGSLVQIIVNLRGVMIVTEGVLKHDSSVGEIARVQILQTGKEIAGKLIEKDKVRLEL